MFTGLKLMAVPYLHPALRGLLKFGDAVRTARRYVTSPEPVIVDIGANEGDFAHRALLAWPRAALYACEPVPSVYRVLARGLGRDPRFHGYECAIAASAGRQTVKVPAYDPASSFYDVNPEFHDFSAPGAPTQTVSVECRTLADFVNTEVRRDVDWMKVDTEGAELEVLATLDQVRHKVRTFQLELPLQEVYKGRPLIHEVMTFMDGRGYRLVDLYGRIENRRGVVVAADGFFAHKSLAPA